MVMVLVVAIAGTVGPNRCRRSNHFLSDTVLHLRVHPSRAFVALLAHSSTCVVANTYRIGVLCSRA